MEIVRVASLVVTNNGRLSGSSFNQIVFEVVEGFALPTLFAKIDNNRIKKDV